MGEKNIGVHQTYKDQAHVGCDVLFRVKIKGRSMLVDDIPLHMSVKIFSKPSEYDLEELKNYVKDHDISSPDPSTLEFKAIIFESERTKDLFYMLQIDGLDPKYKGLYDEYDDVGNVYKRFFPHVTIDKELYEDIKEHGLKPDEIEFGPLIIEHGAGNTFHEFNKSESAPKVQAEAFLSEYKLDPSLIRETILMNTDLNKNYAAAVNLGGDDMRRYLEDHPELSKMVVEKHNQRLSHHFGNDKEKIAFAWSHGINEAYKKR